MAKPAKTNNKEDISQPQEDDTAQKITVSRRPMLGKNGEEVESKDDALLRTEKTKRAVIKPIEETKEVPTSSTGTPIVDEESAPTEDTESGDNKQQVKTEDNKTETAKEDLDTKISRVIDDKKTDDTESPEKVEAAEEEFKRKSQLQEYMDSKQYFVPINQVAMKKNIRRSLSLVLLVLLLSLVLLDLSLDSGAIYLVQRLPHTHFFSARDQLN